MRYKLRNYVTCTCTLTRGLSEQFTLILLDSIVFGMCTTATTFMCTVSFQCLFILTIDFPPNSFDDCDVIDNQLATMWRTSIHISIKMADGQVS